MARNSSGVYSLVAGNPVITGTIIESNWANSTMTDLSTALTDSLSRSGKGGMTAPLKNVSGTATLPAVVASSFVNTGMYWASATDLRITVNGVDRFRYQATGLPTQEWDAVNAVWNTSATLKDLNNPNPIINGGFEDDLWQRGTVFNFTGAKSGIIYTADRWYIDYSDAGNSLGVSRNTLATNYPVTELAGKNTFSFNSVTVASGVNVFGTRLENIVKYLGRTCTVSFYANRVTTGDVVFLIGANYGTGGSSPVAVLSSTLTIVGGNLAKYEVTFTVPQTGTEVIGASSYLAVAFSVDEVTDFNIAEIKFDFGSVSTPYVARPEGQELALCQRFFEVGESYILGSAYAIGANLANNPTFAVTKRVTPAITVTPVFSLNINNLATNSISVSGFRRSGQATAISTNVQDVITYAADSEIY
jgi:hypothetical protein